MKILRFSAVLLVALILALPAEAYLLERMGQADPAPLRAALIHLMRELGQAMQADFIGRYLDLEVEGEYRYHPADAGKRSLRNLWARRLTTALTAGGMALVVFVFAAVLMLAAAVVAWRLIPSSPGRTARPGDGPTPIREAGTDHDERDR